MSWTSVISEETAQKLISLHLRHSAELDALVADLQAITDGEEYKVARHHIASIMVEIFDQGLRPLFARYPDLRPPAWRWD
jgi:hypothetical protein